MRAKLGYKSFLQKLKSVEIFVRPSKKLSGKWYLFEYYTEKNGELIHQQEQELKQEKRFWEIEFLENGKFRQQTNFPSGLLINSGFDRWSLSRNFITLLHFDDFRQNQELQFAIEKDNLRLLKKEFNGEITLFGFFRRIEKKE